MYQTIIWATDGSEGADIALAEAQRLAALTGAKILAVHCDQRIAVRGGAWSVRPDEADRRARIEHQVESLWREGVPIDLVIKRSHRDVADTVATLAAERAADLIVCGTRGRGRAAGAALGSFTHRMLRFAPCPVVVVPTTPGRVRSGASLEPQAQERATVSTLTS